VATSLAAELKERFGVDSTLKAGHGGVFDVVVDGQLLFSKKETKRFPRPGEIGDAIDASHHKAG
jgi:selT/selW/selH-like putative selenoprotein